MSNEVKALRSELALVKLQLSERVSDLEARLNGLIDPDITQVGHQQSEQNGALTSIAENNSPPKLDESNIAEPLLVKTTDEGLAINSQVKASLSAKPSFIMMFLQAALSSIFDWFSPVAKIYQSYKQRGMIGIFLLTIVGIALTLAGFGYLMQLLISQLGAGSKSLLMCIAAILVMGIGIALKLRTKFSEFATSIVTLGILLSYSTVYFSGSVYEILPNITVLFLYLLIALVCHGLALWLDTKIVAGLGIIGIATMPILSSTVQIEPFYYLLSLLFVSCSSLVLAYKRNEPWLANLSLAFCIIALEWSIGIESITVSVWLVDSFYLLFFAYIIMSLFQHKNSSHNTLLLLAALVGSILLLFLQASELFSTQMSVAFALNAILASAISIIFYKIRHNATHLLILLSALWAVLAVVSTVSDAYWGMAWAVEGLLLLYIGRKYEMTSVVNQGQILIAIALVYCWSALAFYFPLPALQSVDGWVLSIVTVAVVAIWQRLLNNSEVFDELTQNTIKPFLQLLEVVWLSILIIASANIWIGNWTGAFVIMVQLALLFRAKQCKQVSIDIFAAILFLVPLLYAYSGALMVDSYRFMLLPLFAKVSVISAFMQLWLWSAFYRKHHPESAIKGIAESVRVLFYLLLPLCWLGSAIRRLDENALMILWLSPLLALFFAQRVKHQLIVNQTKLLTVLASLAFILLVGLLELIYSIIALAGFMTFYIVAFYLDKKTSASKLCQFICSWGLISLGFSVPSIIGFQTDSLLIALVVTSMFWVSYFGMLNFSEHLKRNELFISFINTILIIAAWGLTFSNPIYVLIPFIFLIVALYQKDTRFSNTRLGTSLGKKCDLFLHTVAAISYVTFFAALVDFRLDLIIAPALAVHGAFILFTKDRHALTVKYSFALILLGIVKLALIDASNALLWQKVILFMGIGVFILAASFWYQKLINKTELEFI
ncbi:MAG: DUF2339 domain-containing protein [Colwellia sp.]